MRIGTKILLFGTHNFLLHPLLVLVATRIIWGCWPGWRGVVCIMIHDWGYWGSSHIDGEPQSDGHPRLGAEIAGCLFGLKYRKVVMYHSRTLAKLDKEQTSWLCWPDKAFWLLMPNWLISLLCKLSGELQEYEQTPYHCGFGFDPERWKRQVDSWLKAEGIDFLGKVPTRWRCLISYKGETDGIEPVSAP